MDIDVIPEPFDWEDVGRNELADRLETLTEEELYYRDFSRIDIARAQKRIQVMRQVEQ